ncbi:MAG: nodulation protein NfeD [Synergistaceae bacterium]|jgi:membrane-bound serine protease (ClpP class)|nr:nodulation protein NfeD [Synergistaceae bacterium]
MQFLNLSKTQHQNLRRVTLRILSALLCLSACAGPARAQGSGRVFVAPLNGTVGVQMEQFVTRTIAEAEADNGGLIVFRLDTPGGLVEATRGITQAILASKIPVVMWVPPGGRAASAGAFMMQAAHIAAMASGTNVGAAHPVVASGGDVPDSDMKKKITNDLMAQMRALTQLRDRNEKIAQDMIEESLSLTAQEALQENVIDIVADDLNSLLTAIRGRTVTVGGRPAKIEFANNLPASVEMTGQERLIQFLSSPDIAYLLLVGGMLAIFYEIITPGGFVLGVTGAIMLLLGSIGLKMLPFNWAGIALVGAGVIVMGIDLLVGGVGILSLLGIAVIVAGGVFLFRAPGGELLHVSVSLLAGMAIALGLCFAVFALIIARSLRAKISTGQQGLIGLDVEVIEDLSPEGMVKCHGELWKARSGRATPLSKGTWAVVVALEGIVLIVDEKNHKLKS